MSLTDRMWSSYKTGASSVTEFTRAPNKAERVKDLGRRVLQPQFIPERHWEAKRTEQWLAACLLSFIIPASLAIIVAIDQVFVEFFLNGSSPTLGGQFSVLSFLVNMLGLMFFLLAAWSWFVWVRTGGFRLFEM